MSAPSLSLCLKKPTAPSPTIINTPEELATFRRQHEIFFLLSLSKGREQDELRDTYKAVAQSLKQTASFALTQSDGIAAAGYRLVKRRRDRNGVGVGCDEKGL